MRLRFQLGAFLGVVVCLCTGRAQTVVTWANAGTDFGTGANWIGAIAPTSANIAQFSGSITANPVVNSTAAVAGITIASDATTMNLSGLLPLTVGDSGIQNSSSAPQTISVPLLFAGATPSIATNGTITVSGNVTNSTTGALSLTTGFGAVGTLSGSVGGTGNLEVLTGVNGKWILSGTNTYTGTTKVYSGGTLSISSDTNLGTAPITATVSSLIFSTGTLETTASFTLNSNRGISATGNATLTPAANTTLSYGGIIAGSGTLIKAGAGTLALSGANTYTGGTTINDGALTVGASGAIKSGTNVKVNELGGSGQTATFDVGTSSTSIGTLTFGDLFTSSSGTNNVTISPGGLLTLGGDVTFFNTGAPMTAHVTGNGTLDLGTTNLVSGARFFNIGDSTNAAVEVSIGSTISGSGVGLQKSGSGVLQLGAANTYTGGTSVSAGQLLATNTSGSATGTGNITVASGATLQIGLGSTSGAVSGSIVDNGSLVFNRSDTIAFSSGITGTGLLDQIGLGTVTLGGTNTYSGTTMIGASNATTGHLADSAAGSFSPNSYVAIYGGTLDVNFSETVKGLGDLTINSVVVPGNATLASGATLTLSGGNTFSGTISGAGALQLSSGAFETIAGNASHTGGTNIQSGATLQIGSGGTTGAVAGTITNNGTLIFSRSDAITYGSLTGGGVVMQNGVGTLTLSGANSYTGSTAVNSGTLADANAGAFATGSTVSVNSGTATLNVNYNETIAGLGGGNSSIGSSTNIATGATLTLNNAAQSYLGTISGNGALAISGKSSEFIGGANTYTGGTTINGGLLIATNTSGSATGTGNITIASGATLQLGNNSVGGAVSGNVIDNGTLLYASTDNSTYAGSISGSGKLSVGLFTSTTPGSLTLTGANSYSGGTNITAGTLRIGAANTLPTATGLSFNGNATLDVANNQTIGRFAGSTTGSSIVLGAGQTLTIAPGTSVQGGSFDGTVSGGGGLAIAGASGTSVSINGNNTYSGGTAVNSGTLYIGGNSSLGSGAVTVAGNAALLASKTVQTSLSIANATSLASNATVGATHGDTALTFSGNVTVSTGSATIHLANFTMFSGSLAAASGTTALTFDSAGSFGNAVLLGTASPSITSIAANGAGVIFASTSAVPASGLSLTASTGYIGVGSITGYTTPTAASVLNLIPNRGTFGGSIGFDTLVANAAPHVFTDNLDLTGFGSSVALGSVSSAVLSGTITPAGTDYAFGNGTGVLVVQSSLDGSHGVSVASTTSLPGNYLTAVLQGNNSFTGNLTVTNSLAVLDSASALPTGKTVTLGADGYVGLTEAFTGVTSLKDFITNRLAAYQPTSTIGLDSHTFIANEVSSGLSTGTRSISSNIDLSSLSSIYLGTTTRVAIDGTITAPNAGTAAKTLSLLASNDGVLVINSPLLANNVSRVVVGSSTSGFGSGTVVLAGTSTYTGGTKLLSGTLALQGGSKKSAGSIVAGPIGTGTLTIDGSAIKPALVASSNDVPLANDLAVGTNLQLGKPTTTSTTSTTFTTGTSALTTAGLILDGVIGDLDASHAGSLTVYDRTVLNGANTFTGGVTLQSGTLTLGNDSALGTGTLTIAPNGGLVMPSIDTWNGARTLANNIVFNNGGLSPFVFRGGFALNGSVALNSGVTLATYDGRVDFNGQVTGSGRLMLNAGTLVLNPTSTTNTYSGGTEAVNGRIVFASANAIPSSNLLTADAGGYIGIAFVPSSFQTGFLDKFNKGGTSGTIGFDSASVSSPNTFTDPVNISNFNSATRLGSASSAILASSATITPFSNSYMFGGGGGLLQVASALTDTTGVSVPVARNLVVSSNTDSPLTVRLTGTNTYTGQTSVSGSALVFGAGALPAGNVSIFVGYGAYVGTEDTATYAANPNSFVSRFAPTTNGAVVGFDSYGGSFGLVGAISLTNFNSSTDPSIFLGTSTAAAISGAITLPTAQSAYRFAGYKGGQLTVQSTLSDGSSARSVVIGDTTIPAMFGSTVDSTVVLSSVTLSGNNTYTGGTTLNSGALYVGSDTALGTGTLTVASNSGPFGQDLGLFAAGGARTLSNAITLGSSASLDLGGSNALTLNGAISGSGDLNKVGAAALTLAGNNSSFTGDFYVKGGSVTFVHGNSVGTGALVLGSAGASATFLDNSTVNGLYGDSALDAINLTTAKTLTIHQTFDSDYAGTFAGTTGGLIFNGDTTAPVHLRLAGASSYTGPTTIQPGISVVAGNANAFGATSNMVTLNGGKLAVDQGVTLTNPVTLTSGKIGGVGTFKPTAAFDIKTNLILAPGLGNAGKLTFDGSLLTTSALILDGGGQYNWQIVDATNVTSGSDLIVVNGNVDVTATSASPFKINILSIAPDGTTALASNFDPSQPYSWTILTATHINGFTSSSQFNVSSLSFMNANSGQFSLALNPSATGLVLNFSPVPEPSTYALMLAGLGVTLFAARRRRRR